MAFREGFLSEIVGRPVLVETAGGPVASGRIVDLLVERPDQTFPEIGAIVVRTRAGRKLVPVAEIRSVRDDGSVVLTAPPSIDAPPDDETLYLVEDLLDKQIVDVDGRKVVRINDLEVALVGGALRVVAADVGPAGLLRRLGAGALVPRLGGRLRRSLIAWDNVAPISDANPTRVMLNVTEARLARLHPSDLAAVVGDLSAQDALRVIASLDDERAADALEHLDAETQQSIIEDLGTERAADIVEEMDADDAADLLNELDESTREGILAEMEPETAEDLRELVRYAEDTAGGLMTTDYVWIYPHRTVGATIVKLREIAPETEFVYYLYVLDREERLQGVLSLRTLLLADPEATIDSLMDTDVVRVGTDTSAEDAAATIARYDLLALPVVTPDGVMIGIVTVDDAIDAVMPERLKRALPRFTHRHRTTAPG